MPWQFDVYFQFNVNDYVSCWTSKEDMKNTDINLILIPPELHNLIIDMQCIISLEEFRV